MGRGRVNAEEIFYGAAAVVGDERAAHLAREALEQENWLELWGLFERHRELYSEDDLIREALSKRGEGELLKIFSRNDFPDWDVVRAFLLQDAHMALRDDELPEIALTPDYQQILRAGLSSGGQLGDACRDRLSAHHLRELPQSLVIKALSEGGENKEALVAPLARALSDNLLAFSGSNRHSQFAGLVQGRPDLVHLRSLYNHTQSACGEAGYGYASLPRGSWVDAGRGLMLAQCQECSKAAKGQVLRGAEEESPFGAGIIEGVEEDDIFDIVTSVGLPSLQTHLGRGQKKDWSDDWPSCREAVCQEMTEAVYALRK